LIVTVAFTALLVLHGLLHMLGVAKAFGLAELAGLSPVSRPLGLVWGMAALLFLGAALSVWNWPRGWWAMGLMAIALSMVAILSAWSDARAGVIGNAIVAVGVVIGFLTYGPFSLRAEYEADVRNRLQATVVPTRLSETDLARLPEPVQRYIRLSGAVGQPRVEHFTVRMHGRIRGGRDDRWMPFTAEQHNFQRDPARLFYLNASMFGVPIQGYHRYVRSTATMRVKAAALVRVATESGAEMTQSETVTLFNDMCLLAPATLIDPSIVWSMVDALRVRARFANAGHTIHADLFFNDAGELTNFVSNDRYQAGPDGMMRQVSWSTPLSGYRWLGPVRMLSTGEGRWRDAGGDYPYIQLTIDQVDYSPPW